MKKNHTILSSPLQGFTEFRFRNAVHTNFGGVDTFYAPYIRLNGKLEIKPNYERDLLPKNNHVPHLIPQIITNDATEFLFVAKYVQTLGYTELNWNLGCPYPMVTKRCMGSGLISDAQRIASILEQVTNESDITVSMKMRMGYENAQEILHVLPLIEQFPIKSIGIHARIGKQLYKGGVDLEAFDECLKHTSKKIYYNGDLTSLATFHELVERFPTIDHWMIGRGLIANPFLPQLIKNNSNDYPTNRKKLFTNFLEELFEGYASALSGHTHVLTKMTSYWEYFAESFENPHKVFKKIKKAKTILAYHQAVHEILDEGWA